MLKEIWHFFKNPSSLDIEGVSEPLRVNSFFRVYWFCLKMSIISGIFILITDSILLRIAGFSIGKNIIVNHTSYDSYWKNLFWFFTIIVAPISEEIIFRLPLSNHKRGFSFAIAFSIFYFSRGKISTLNIEDFTLDKIFLFVLTLLSLLYFLKEECFLKFRKKYFNFLCRGLIILFSSMHIANYSPIDLTLLYLYPIYVLPQFISAICFSFLMVKYKNIIWPILVHMLINSTALILKSIH